MPSSRVVRVRSAEDGVAPQVAARRHRRIQAGARGHAGVPAGGRGGRRGGGREPPAARPRPHRPADSSPSTRPGAMDLDQALHLARPTTAATCVHYAIADVAAFVTPGDPVDVEAHRRGQTLYGADTKIPLHPTVALRGRRLAAARPGAPRAAVDDHASTGTGDRTDVDVERALVRSPGQLDYDEAQQPIDDGTADESLMLLREVGELRLEREAERGGVSLPLPEQEVDVEGRTWQLEFRDLLPVEEWNAQISLLTGFAAAVAHDLRPGRACCAPCRRRTRATSSGCTAPPARSGSTGRPSCSTPTSSAASTRRCRSTPRWSTPAPGCCAAAGTSPSTARRPRSRSTRALATEYAHVPPRCAGWATGTPARSASPCAPTPRCPTGCAPRCPGCPKTMQASGRSGRAATSAWSSTWSRPGVLAAPGRRELRRRRGRRRRQGPARGVVDRARPRRRGAGGLGVGRSRSAPTSGSG